jgi:hypothetical protein
MKAKVLVETKLIHAKLVDGDRITLQSDAHILAPNCFFDNDGYLYFSIGERGAFCKQDLKRDGGKYIA